MKDTWRSERLLYRGFDIPGDDEFLLSVLTEPEIFINGSNVLPRPPSAADIVEARKGMLESSLLYAVICKIPEPMSLSADDHESRGDGNEKPSRKHTATPVGFINLRKSPSPRLAHHRSTHMGIFIAKEWHGNGYGPEAINWILHWAFRMAGLHRVGLEVYEYNTKAQKLYEALGFIVEGRERESCWYDGKWWDIITMGILDHEWAKLQRTGFV